jgi:lysine biosynthesis protein LysW
MSNRCPTCHSILDLERPIEINQQVLCSNCGLELEVIWLYPLELAKVISYKPDPNRKKHLQKTTKHK